MKSPEARATSARLYVTLAWVKVVGSVEQTTCLVTLFLRLSRAASWKVLSANSEASISLEYLMEDIDF